MELIQKKCSINKGILVLILLVFSVGALGCASLKGKDKTTLLLEEIQKEQAKTGEPVDENALWESAQIEKRWVPDQFRANRYIPGHYEYVVVNPGHWKSK
jgi:hypothetical protein